jgi:hypothetical protein
MNGRLWWILACIAIQVGWISPRPATAQQPTGVQEPVAGQVPLFTQVPLATQTQEPAPTPKKLGGQIFISAGGAFLPGPLPNTMNPNNGHAGFSLGFGADLPILRDPLFGNTLLGELALNYGQFSDSNLTVNQMNGYLSQPTLPPNIIPYSKVTVNELAIVGAPKYRIELGRLRPWIIPIGMEFLFGTPNPTGSEAVLNVGIPFGAGLDYMLTPSVSVGLDWRYNLNLSPSAISFGSFMTYGAYVGYNF